jgi:hypothetical protein
MIDTLFGRVFHPHARARRSRACGRRGGLNQITSADEGTSVLTPSYDARAISPHMMAGFISMTPITGW